MLWSPQKIQHCLPWKAISWPFTWTLNTATVGAHRQYGIMSESKQANVSFGRLSDFLFYLLGIKLEVHCLNYLLTKSVVGSKMQKRKLLPISSLFINMKPFLFPQLNILTLIILTQRISQLSFDQFALNETAPSLLFKQYKMPESIDMIFVFLEFLMKVTDTEFSYRGGFTTLLICRVFVIYWQSINHPVLRSSLIGTSIFTLIRSACLSQSDLTSDRFWISQSSLLIEIIEIFAQYLILIICSLAVLFFLIFISSWRSSYRDIHS